MPQWVEDCVASVKPSLRKKYPKASDKQITSRAFAICQAQYKKKKGKEAMGFKIKEADCHKLAGDTASNYAIPRLKALPYKSSSGPNAACVRNALARLNQVKGATSAEKKSALAKLRRAAKSLGIKTKDQSEMSNEVFHYVTKMQTFTSMREALSFIDGKGGVVYGREEAMKIIESEPDPSANYYTGAGNITLTYSGTSTGYISESTSSEPTHFYIAGEAIHALTTRNMNTYLAEELRLAAPTLAGKTIQLDHSTKSIDTVGKVIVSSYDETSQSVSYIGRIQREHPIARSVESGDIDTVSIGAYADDVTCSICGESKVRGHCTHVVGREYEGEIATAVGKGLNFVELSITPVPADPRASAGVTSYNSLESALVALVESYRGINMSEEDVNPNEDLLSDYENKIEELQKELGESKAAERRRIAEGIAEAEVQLGERYAKDKDNRVEELSAQPKEALMLLESSLRNRLKHQTPKPESKGAIATTTESRKPNQITVEEAKAFLREGVFGFPPPSAEAKRVVAKMRRNPEHPMAAEYARIFREGEN